MTNFSPREIVSELDRFIVGQNEAKKAVAIALRNRWRRRQLPDALRDEVSPKNILMIGPTGVGKTEIARRIAKTSDSPFIKVEATKFTEVGYVGRDVEQIIRDLLDSAIFLVREKRRKEIKVKTEAKAEEDLVKILHDSGKIPGLREEIRQQLRDKKLDNEEVEIQVEEQPSIPAVDIPGMPAGSQMSMLNIGDLFGKFMGSKTRTKRLKVKEAFIQLANDESDKLLDKDKIISEALQLVEEDGIVFIDEIDKICGRSGAHSSSADVSREGVQRDLLPLVEGTTVSTKHGPVKTNHILFIASGAFHIAKPSDLLPELQGRFPIRVELKPLTKNDFKRILTEPEASLIKQYCALLSTEGISLTFEEDAIDKISDLATQINNDIENIGARRLHTILEKVLEDISFTASDRADKKVAIDAAYVMNCLKEYTKNNDLSRFIL